MSKVLCANCGSIFFTRPQEHQFCPKCRTPEVDRKHGIASNFDTRGLSRDPLAQEPALDYPTYVDGLLRENGVTPQPGATLQANEFILSELYPEVNPTAGYAAYIHKHRVGAA